jgi:putative hydrolase of the HAD superfamily
MTIEAVFFDMGGTLAYGEPNPWEIFIQTCERHGFTVTITEINEVKAGVDAVYKSRQFLTREGLQTHPIDRYRRILEGLGVEHAHETATEVQETLNRRGRVHLYPEVMDLLLSLREREMYLGIISNTVATLEEGCRRLGIWEYFDLILASDLLRSKPDEMMFRLAIAESDLPAISCLHVGDSYRADYLGAKGVGMRAVLLDREGTSEHDCPTISDLAGIEDFLT